MIVAGDRPARSPSSRIVITKLMECPVSPI
jgi:hypothetical protein